MKPIFFVVENNKNEAEAMRDFFLAKGFECKVFYSGGDFLSSISENFDGVIIEINLPDVEGLKLLSKLRSSGSNLPVIMISGDNLNLTRMEALEQGADYFLPKPLDFGSLEHICDELVARGGDR